MILRKGQLEEAKKYVREQLKNLVDGNVNPEELRIYKKLSKKGVTVDTVYSGLEVSPSTHRIEIPTSNTWKVLDNNSLGMALFLQTY